MADFCKFVGVYFYQINVIIGRVVMNLKERFIYHVLIAFFIGMLAFLVGKTVERTSYESLYRANQELYAQRIQTEGFVSKYLDVQGRTAFRQLGYNIQEPDTIQ